MSGYMDMSELMEVFLEEADEQLQRLDDGILALEKSPDDLELVKEVFRAAHTLKGSSASMGFEQIADLTHTMETLLDKLRTGQVAITPTVVDALLAAVDALRALVQYAHAGSTDRVPLDDILQALRESTDSPAAVSAIRTSTSAEVGMPDGCDGSIRIEAAIANDCLMPSVRGFMVLNCLSDKGTIVASSPDESGLDSLQPGESLVLYFRPNSADTGFEAELRSICEIDVTIDEPLDAVPVFESALQSQETQVRAEATPRTIGAKVENESLAHSMQTVRVGVDRLDALMNLVGELVIDRTRIGQIENALGSRYEGDSLIGGLTEASLHLGRITNELQEQIMKIRMLPVDQVFNRFPRMVRDLARKAGKSVEFVISGEETELDRSILEDIVDPITHLLRNSIDHGIESPEERASAGKPRTAVLRLAAKHEENRIVIEVHDDGRGINALKVRDAAVAKGAITREAAERMSEKECLQLIFGAGVSTAEKVTDVSGRGVGMDVVKSNIERLSGTVDIDTEPGMGTKISLRLPLTLAIVQALITAAQDRVFAIPLISVVETSRYKASQVMTIHGRPVLQFRDSVLPLVNLGQVFKSRRPEAEITGNDRVVVIVKAGGQQVGVAVDGLIGEQEVVIKSLGAYFGMVEGISGTALLGDGKIALIMDVSALPTMIERELCRTAA